MSVRILSGDCREVLKTLPDESVHCVVTSPPYWGLRDYGTGDAGIGLEDSLDEHLDALVEVFGEVRRVLRSDGVLWLNYGDFYSGGGRGGNPGDSEFRKQATNVGSLSVRSMKRNPRKPKDLVGAPWRVAFALQEDGWWLRSDVIWHKPNPMPESVTDRPTRAHEYVFLLTKSARYWYDADAVRSEWTSGRDDMRKNGLRTGGSYVRQEGPQDNSTRPDKQRGHSRRHAGFNDRWDAMPKAEQQAMGANLRSVWTIATAPYAEAHFATFPPALAERCILAGCPEGGVVLDPFGGAGTTGLVADRLRRDAILIELNPEYRAMSERRIVSEAGMFADVTNPEEPHG